jgi:PAT family beta-lactamase induction signal transducer AmpG
MFSFLSSFRPLLDRRFLTVFLLGFSSGFPWVLHGSVLTLWMQSEGLSRTEIGFIGAVTAIYALNWMWSPLIDEIKLPWLHKRLGQRKSWIVFTQALMILFMLLLSRADPQGSLLVLGIFALGIALASATQDIAVDAYRIMLFGQEEADAKLPFSSALATTGWWAGYGFIGGTLALWLGSESAGLAWPQVYVVLALVYVVLMVLVWLAPEAGYVPPRRVKHSSATALNWFRHHIAAPFTEFFERCGVKLALAILLFLFSFRIGEAMLGRMSLVFYVELGFSTEEIALYQKFLGGLATVVFSLLGAVINTHYGVIRGMLVGGIAMAASNLLYAVMAQVGPEPWLFVVTLLVDNFCQAFATVAVISFMSYFASRTYTGTQFAMMTSFSNFGRTTLAASSGAIVDGMGGNWALFFVATTLMVIPALLLLVWVGKLLEQYKVEQAEVELSRLQQEQSRV